MLFVIGFDTELPEIGANLLRSLPEFSDLLTRDAISAFHLSIR
jgi:hypothetical protein